MVAFLADGTAWAADRLAREPGWVIDSALRAGDGTVFAEHLSQGNSHELAKLKLGKKTDQLVEEATVLHKKLDRYAYGAPAFRFSEAEVDQARAAGVVIEFERSAPIIVDRAVYRELAKAAIKRTVAELCERLAARKAERKANRSTAAGPADPVADARREEQAQLRALGERAHGVNLDIGAGLLNGLSAVDPADLSVARFFVYGALGADWTGAGYGQEGERVARLAASGIRLVIDEFRTDVTKTKKDGTRGKLRIDYGDPRKPADPVQWLWRFIDGARSAGELYGRALVVIAAEQYASRLVVPQSQRAQPTRWTSHKQLAEKALARLAGPHLPASLKELERAIAKTHAQAQRATKPAARAVVRTVTQNVDAEAAHDTLAEDELVGDEDLDLDAGGE